MSKRRIVLLVAVCAIAWASVGASLVSGYDEERPGGTTGISFVSNKYVWVGDTSRYGQVAVEYHLEVQAGTVVYARWECSGGNGPTDSMSGGVNGGEWDVSGDDFDGAHIVLSSADTYCAYHVWRFSGTGGFRIVSSSVQFWNQEFEGGGPGNPAPSGTAGPGTSVEGPTPTPSPSPPDTCGTWRGPFVIDPPSGPDFQAFRLDACAGSFTAPSAGTAVFSGQSAPSLPTLAGTAHILTSYWGTGIGRTGPGYWQGGAYLNGVTAGVLTAHCCPPSEGTAPPYANIVLGSQAHNGYTVQLTGVCSYGGACGGSIPAGGYDAGGVTLWWYENNGELGCTLSAPGTVCTDATPSATPTPTASPSATPTPTPPPPGGGYFPPFPATPTPGPNLGGSEGFVDPSPRPHNPTGIAECDDDDGTFSKVGQAPLQPLNDTSFPGSINPLDYLPWLGNMMANVPIVIGNTAQWATNTGVDFVVPGDCVADIITEQQTALFAEGPLSVYEDVRGQVEGAIAATASGASAGNCTFEVPLPGGGGACIPFASWAASVSGVRNFLVVGIWFFTLIGVYRIIVGAFRVAKADIEDGRNLDVWLG